MIGFIAHTMQACANLLQVIQQKEKTMKYIKTNFLSSEFNIKVENKDLQGKKGIEIYRWILSVRLYYGIKDDDMRYIYNYFMS